MRWFLVILTMLTMFGTAPGADDAASRFAAGDIAGARDVLQAQWDAHVTAGTDTSRAALISSFDLGACHLRLGALGAARLAFERAVAGFGAQEPRDELAVALALEGLVATLAAQENPTEAREHLDRALAIRARHFPPDHPQRARLDALAGRIARLQDDRDAAFAALERAKEAYRRIHGNLHPTVAMIVSTFADLYLQWGHDEDARTMAIQGDYIAREVYGAEAPERVPTLAAVGRVHWARREYAEAIDAYRHALAVAEGHGRAAVLDVAVCELGLGRALLALGQTDEARRALGRAADAYERAWWQAGGAASRATFMASPYPLLAAAELQAGDGERAWAALEQHHGRTLRHAMWSRAMTAEERARRDSLRQRRVAVGDRLEAAAAAGRAHEVAAMRAERAAVDEALGDLENQLRERLGDEMAAVSRPTGLPDGTALIGWLDVAIERGEPRSWAWVIRADGSLTWRTLAGGIDVDALAARLREALGERTRFGPRERERQATIAATATALHAARIAPVADLLDGVTDLLAVPDAALAGVPLAVLRQSNGEPLVARMAVTTLPAVTGLEFKPRRTAGSRLLAIADPPFNPAQREAMDRGETVAADHHLTRSALLSLVRGGRAGLGQLARLPATRTEVARIADHFDTSEILVGPEASEPALRDLQAGGALAGFDVVHVATHALVDADRPERSALVLSQVDLEADDGLLTAAEITAAWRLNADLVTLSACETGLGRPAPGEGYLGFTQTLLAAGARSVLVSLWQVDDRATALLMPRFYANVRERGLGQAAALREAQQWLRAYEVEGRRPFADERFWGAFVLVGAG